jgi:CRISPR/Cas system-associated endoribonuclease Cas2
MSNTTIHLAEYGLQLGISKNKFVVKNSIFEIISENNLNKLVKDIQNIVDKTSDNLRCYILDKISVKKSFSLTEKTKPFERKDLFF